MSADRQQRPAGPDRKRAFPQHAGRTRHPAGPTAGLTPATAYALQRTIGTERQYGFAVRVEQSLNRVGATAEAFASLPDALAASGHAPSRDAPGEYVQPHKANEFGVEFPSVFGLVDYCDVAMLLDFEWAPQIADEFAEAAKAGTPPHAVRQGVPVQPVQFPADLRLPHAVVGERGRRGERQAEGGHGEGADGPVHRSRRGGAAGGGARRRRSSGGRGLPIGVVYP